MATTTRRVKYIVQAYRGGKWARIYSTYSYRLAREKANSKRGRRRVMCEAWIEDVTCFNACDTPLTFGQWQEQSDAERDAKEWARREQ